MGFLSVKKICNQSFSWVWIIFRIIAKLNESICTVFISCTCQQKYCSLLLVWCLNVSACKYERNRFHYKYKCLLVISLQCINHAAKPSAEKHTLYFGAGRHSQGAGRRGQETAAGRLVPAGLYPWQGGERRPAMGDKRHGPGSSLTMLLAGRAKCKLPDLPGPFHKHKQKVI